MFRTFNDVSDDDRRRQQQHAAKASVFRTKTANSTNNDDEKVHIVRDRTNETQTTVSSLSGIYSTDLLTEYSGDYTMSDQDFIVSISKPTDDNEDSGEIMDEVDLDGRSESTTVTSNQILTNSDMKDEEEEEAPMPSYISSLFPDIPKSSSWVEDKPFDEESLLNLSDIGEADRARMLPSYYSNNAIPVKEYILPPPPPPPLPASPPDSPPPPPPPRDSSSQPQQRVDEVIEIAPEMEAGKRVARVAWVSPADSQDEEEEEDFRCNPSVDGSAAPGMTVSTASSSKARSFQSKNQKERSRRLKVCVIAGCIVALLSLIVIIVAVAVSNNNNKNNNQADLSSSTVQSSQNSPPTMAPSLRATAAPTQAPTVKLPWYDENATVPPTNPPTAAPTTAPPTASPTARPTPSPTARPTSAPVPAPSPAPTVKPTECVNSITTAQDCLFSTDNVLMVDFQNCDPEDGDWVGLYPNGSEFQEGNSGTEFLSREWVSWAWSCGDRDCESSPSSNSFGFSIDMGDPTFTLFNMRAYLVRGSNSGPPFEVIAKSEPFAYTDQCNP